MTEYCVSLFLAYACANVHDADGSCRIVPTTPYATVEHGKFKYVGYTVRSMPWTLLLPRVVWKVTDNWLTIAMGG